MPSHLQQETPNSALGIGILAQQQLRFGSMSIIELARLLPLPSYSLGKAAVEQTVRLVAPELARRRITVNAINPSFIPTDMNKQSTERQQMKEAALVPLGRLCRTDDVAGLVRFLLSPEAAFISGQAIGLTGAQL